MSNQNQRLQVHSLQFNYKTNPIGISPELPIDWKLEAADKVRNVVQTAYQLQLSSEDGHFGRLLADSGMVSSDQSVLGGAAQS